MATELPKDPADNDRAVGQPVPPSQGPTEREGRVALAGAGMGLLAVFTTCGFTLAALAIGGTTVLSGSQILVAFGLVAVALLVFLAFLFGRLLTIRATKGDDSVEIKAGDKVR